MKLLDTELFGFSYQAGARLLSFHWTEKSADMTDQDFKSALLRYAGFVEGYRPSSLLIDVRRFRHRMTPELGAWRDEVISPRYSAAGVRRLAFILPAGAPTPPAEEEPPALLTFITGYFASKEDAHAWLEEG